MRSWLELVFLGCSVAFLVTAAALVARQQWPSLRRTDRVIPVVILVTPVLFVPSWHTMCTCLLLAGGTAAVRWRWPWLSPPGATALTLGAVWFALLVGWLPVLGFDAGFGVISRVILLTMFGITVVTLVPMVVAEYMGVEFLLRDSWTRPRLPFAAPVRHSGPHVSVHVPCYAEPPDMVIETLNSLARLDYDDFEVLVVDNNTKDPALWRPVEQHCLELGSRFRFFHVDPLTGAKGGALNFALRETCPDTELIALVDADHQVEPDFLSRLAGHFRDPRLAVVQTLYDYRDWRGRRFLTACFWSYRFGFPTSLRAFAERGAASPMGTMCLLRRSAVEQVGGWSEHVITEDSELGLRLTAAGYTTLLFEISCGKGLIPERFADYAAQRFRWVYGPVQTFKEHWRLLVPALRQSHLTAAQRLLFLVSGPGQLRNATLFVTVPLSVALLVSMIAHGEQPPMPAGLLAAAAVTFVGLPALRLSSFHYASGARWRDCVAGTAAIAALLYTCALASTSAMLTTTTRWRRTNKFKVTSSGWRALRAARAETVISVVSVLLCVACLLIDHTGNLVLVEVVLLLRGLRLLVTPAAVLIADHDLRRSEELRHTGDKATCAEAGGQPSTADF